MKVKLIAYTPDPERVVAAAARICYSKRSGDEIMENFTEQEIGDFLKKMVQLGHTSTFEHASFTFAVDGVSRSLSHQLVRHRIGASYSQKSQRYVKEKQFEYITPNSIAEDPGLNRRYQEIMSNLAVQYNELLTAGIPAEDARYLLPNACTTNFVLTMNARSLLHFFELRCCMRAQDEIRELAFLMLKEVKKVAPVLFSRAGATCVTQGICYEGEMSCGKFKDVKVLSR